MTTTKPHIVLLPKLKDESVEINKVLMLSYLNKMIEKVTNNEITSMLTYCVENDETIMFTNNITRSEMVFAAAKIQSIAINDVN